MAYCLVCHRPLPRRRWWQRGPLKPLPIHTRPWPC